MTSPLTPISTLPSPTSELRSTQYGTSVQQASDTQGTFTQVLQQQAQAGVDAPLTSTADTVVTAAASTTTAHELEPSSLRQAAWHKDTEKARQYLHEPGTDLAAQRDSKPNIAAFMRATGADFQTASATLSGVVGSNQDWRDWSAIMAADDPLLAARQATAAMYNSDLPFTATGSDGLTPNAEQVMAKSGNFAWLNIEDRQGLWLLDGQGTALRQVPVSAPDILRAARDFGLNLDDLNGLAEQMDAQNIRYQPGQLHEGSSLGVDLRDLARGGMGSAHDWRSDPLAYLKGPDAQYAVTANALLAKELGLTSSPA